MSDPSISPPAASPGTRPWYRVVPTRLHGVIDYAVGALMIAAPWLFRFARGGPETTVFVALGVGVLLYSAFTRYELGLWRRLPMTAHLSLDLVTGILLAASPWLFSFDDLVVGPHVAFGVFSMVAAVVTRRTPEGELSASRTRWSAA